jgi:hypothetical protein
MLFRTAENKCLSRGRTHDADLNLYDIAAHAAKMTRYSNHKALGVRSNFVELSGAIVIAFDAYADKPLALKLAWIIEPRIMSRIIVLDSLSESQETQGFDG